MNKKRDDNLLFSYAYLDSQRLKDTFFSPSKKKKKKLPPKKNLFVPVGIAILMVLVVFILFAKYEFIVVNRQNIGLEKNTISLLHGDISSGVRFLGKDKHLMKAGSSFIRLIIPAHEKTGLIINLKKPIDVRADSIYLYLKKPDVPLNVGAIIRDNRYFSNSLNPLVVKLNEKSSSYIKIPLEFKNVFLQNANPSQIEQINLYFYPEDKEKINVDGKSTFNESWALIKELVLVKKGGK
jgi:hypothetical protein